MRALAAVPGLPCAWVRRWGKLRGVVACCALPGGCVWKLVQGQRAAAATGSLSYALAAAAATQGRPWAGR
jgi:hypothetical protein